MKQGHALNQSIENEDVFLKVVFKTAYNIWFSFSFSLFYFRTNDFNFY